MVLQSIFLNSTNVVYNSDGITYNKMKYKFSTPVEFKNNAKMALGNLNLYYSWFNISASYGNNSFSYVFRNQSRTFTLADGNYSIDDINELFIEYMRGEGHYTYNTTTNVATYYIALKANASLYAIQVNLLKIPTSASTSSTTERIGENGTWTAPANPETPQFIVNNDNFTKIIGFNAGTYPAAVQSSNQSFTSTFTPQVNPISCIVMTCNLTKQKYSTPNNIFYTFGAGGTAFGDQIKIEPNEYQFTQIANGIYDSVDLIFYDQLNRSLTLRDEEIIVNLLIELNEDK